MKKITLKNGLNILYYPIDTAYSTVISLNINAGIFLENSKNNGLTHFLEHIHFRRLNDVDQNELYYQMNKIGSNLNGSTYKELLKFYAKIRPRYFKEVISIFNKLLTADKWNEDDINYEKPIILNEIREKQDYFDFDALIHSYIFEGTPYSMPILGSCETVSNITTKDLVQYKRKIFAKENVAIVITGKITDSDIIECKSLFENIQLSDFKHIYIKEKITKPSIKIFNEDFDYPCAVLSFPIDSSINNSEITLLNSILGEGTGSLLDEIIREKLGLSYNVYSYIELYKVGSFLNIYFSSDYNDIYECLSNIINILNKIKINISNKDMDTNVPYYTDNMWYLLENNEQLNSTLSWEVFGEKHIKSIEERVLEFQQINKQALVKLANKIFTKDKCTFIGAGKFKNFNIGKIENIISRL